MYIENVKQLGKIIKKERKKQEVTQVQLAGICGLGVRFIVDVEAGKETCQIGKTLHVIKCLGMSLELGDK